MEEEGGRSFGPFHFFIHQQIHVFFCFFFKRRNKRWPQLTVIQGTERRSYTRSELFFMLSMIVMIDDLPEGVVLVLVLDLDLDLDPVVLFRVGFFFFH